MRKSFPSSFVISLLALAGAASAGVFARIHGPEDAVRMWKLHEKRGGALAIGQIVSREIVKTTMPDLGEVEITALTISASDLVTARQDLGNTLKAYYLGGIGYQTSAQPAEGATKPGTQAAFFLRPNEDSRFPGFWIDGSNSIISTVKSTSGETILLGQGDGSVNPANRKASDFFALHRTALAKVQSEKK